MPWTHLLPSVPRAAGTVDPANDANAFNEALAAMGAGLVATNPVFGADPTGATDSTAAIQAALNACTPGQHVYLPAGVYQTTSPIVVPPYVGLAGDLASPVISGGFGNTVSAGTILKPSSGFTAGSWPVASVLLIVDPTTGGYSGQSEEQHVEHLFIDGANLPGSGVTAAANTNGITIYSSVSNTVLRTTFRDVFIYAMSGWGFQCAVHAAGQIRAFNVSMYQCGKNTVNNAGGWQINAADSRFLYCMTNACTGDAFQITNTYDSAFIACHAEHSTANGSSGYGFNYSANINNSSATIAQGGVQFIGCDVDSGDLDGFLITSTNTNAMIPVTIVGGYVRRCGASSSSSGYAGYRINSYPGPVSLIGVNVYPDIPDGGGGVGYTPQYGVSVTNGFTSFTNVTVSGGAIIGQSAAFHADGTQQALIVGPDVVFGSGNGNSVTTYAPGVPLQAAASTELVPVDRALYTMPANTLATSLERTSVTTNVTPSTGIPLWRLVTLVAGVPVTNINTWVTATAKSGGTHGWVGIVTVNAIPGSTAGKVVAVSADQTDAATTWGSTAAAQVIALSSAYIPPVTGPYWLGVSITATTMPALGSGPSLDSAVANSAPVFCGSSASQTTPPAVGAAVTVSSAAADNLWIWAT